MSLYNFKKIMVVPPAKVRCTQQRPSRGAPLEAKT